MSHRLEELLKAIERLEPFPQNALRVLGLAHQDGEARDIVAAIVVDPGLTAKVLGLANSARSAPAVPVHSIEQALTRLGRRSVANLAMTCGAASYYAGYGDSTPRSNLGLWHESLHCAVLARRLAQRLNFADSELAYTTALLQNIGHIVMDRFFTEERQEILKHVRQGENMMRAERAVLGMDHAFCGYRIALKWGLPERLVQGIRFHHAPHSARGQGELCSILNLAENLTARSLWSWETSMLYPGHGASVSSKAPHGRELEDVLEDVHLEVAEIHQSGA